MELGYEVFEEERDFTQSGITGEVKRYTTTSMAFPCYIIHSDEDHTIKKFKINVLRKMFSTGVGVDADSGEDLGIHIYFSQGGQTARLGKIYPKQVKSFLQLFSGDVVSGYLDGGTELKGDLLYVLSC